MKASVTVAAAGSLAMFVGVVLAVGLALGSLAGVAAGLIVGGGGLVAFAELVLSARKPKPRRR